MRVLVMGSGGLGGYFGGVLARAGLEVTFVGRGAHLEALRSRGLTVKSRLIGDFSLQVNATDDPVTAGLVDLVLFCVKTYDLDQAAEQIRSVVGPRTTILPVQNGVDTAKRLGRYVLPQQVLGGVSYVSSHLEAPGLVVHDGGTKLVFGELAGGTSPRVQRMAECFAGAGLDVELHSNIRTALWEKYLIVCATSGLTALTRLPLGVILASGELRELVVGVLGECQAVARASGIRLTDDTVERLLALLDGFSPQARASQYYDLIAGRRLELEALSGTLVRLGQARGVPTPMNFAIYAALKPYVDGAPDQSPGARPNASGAST